LGRGCVERSVVSRELRCPNEERQTPELNLDDSENAILFQMGPIDAENIQHRILRMLFDLFDERAKAGFHRTKFPIDGYVQHQKMGTRIRSTLRV